MSDHHSRSIGYLVTPEKAAKHLSTALRQRAERAGLTLVELDAARPIAEQGRFDAIVHKVVGDARREARLREFQLSHADVPIIDPVNNIRPLHDRATMLGALSGGITILAPHDAGEANAITVAAPAQVTLPAGVSVAAAIDAMEDAGLQLPVLAKPQHAGRPGSHELALVRDLPGLQSLVFETEDSGLRLPVVLQQYIPHGGLLTKVFAIGAATVMVQRPSLEADTLTGSGLINLSRVSKFRGSSDGARTSGSPVASASPAAADTMAAANPIAASARRSSDGGMAAGISVPGRIEVAAEHAAAAAAAAAAVPGSDAAANGTADSETAADAAHAARDAAAAVEPPEWFIRGLTRELQHELGLQLFDYDLLCPIPGAPPESESSRYHVIDINAFPGYEKLPDYEAIMTEFLRAVVQDSSAGSQQGGYGPATFSACSQL